MNAKTKGLILWAYVSLPLAWGVYRTLLSVAKFFV